MAEGLIRIAVSQSRIDRTTACGRIGTQSQQSVSGRVGVVGAVGVFGKRLLDGEVAGRHPPGEVGVDRAVRLALLPGAVLDPREFPRRGFDLATPDALALPAGDVDRSQDVPHPAGAGPQIRGGSGLVDEFDRNVAQVLEQPCTDQPRPVADAHERVRGVGHLLADDLGGPLGGHLEGSGDSVTLEHRDPGTVAGVDSHHRPSAPLPERGRDGVDGRPGVSSLGLDDCHLGFLRDRTLLVGAPDKHRRTLGELLARFDGGEVDATLPERGHHLVVELEIGRRDDDHTPSRRAGHLADPGRTGTLDVEPRTAGGRRATLFSRPVEAVGVSSTPDAAPGRTDLTFALVGGLYAAALAAPLAVLVAPLPDDPGVQYAALLAVSGAVTVAVGATLRRTSGLPARLGAGPRRFLPAALAPVVGAAGYGVVRAAGGEPTGADTALLVLAAGGGLVVGGLLAPMADSRYAKAVVDAVATHAEWRAPWPDHRRRVARRAGIGVFALGVVLLTAGVVLDWWPVRAAGQVGAPLGAILVTFGRNRNYRATAAGLEVREPVRRHLSPWGEFEGYAVTEEAVVLYPRQPWRLPVYSDRDAIDTDAVVEALDRHLPRLPAG